MSTTQINTLISRREYLLKEEERLLDELKEKFSEAYEWLQSHGVDFSNIGTYYKNVALALLITSSVASVPVSDLPSDTMNRETIETIAVEDIRSLSEDDQVRLVWYRYGPLIKENATKYDVDENLIFATIMLESRGDAYAYRYEPHINDASYGLGQILYGTARGIGFEGTPDDLYDPEKNIELIAMYHRRNQDVYGGSLTAEELTIAYNAGSPYSSPHPGHIQKFNNWYRKIENIT